MSSEGLFILHSQIMRTLSGRFEPSLRVHVHALYYYLICTLGFFCLFLHFFNRTHFKGKQLDMIKVQR